MQWNIGYPINWTAPLNRGLIAWWLRPPVQVSTARLLDLCGKYHGTLSGGPGWSGQSRAGGWGGINLDGTNDSVNVGVITTPSSAITLAGWVNVKNGITGHNWRDIISKENNATEPQFSYCLEITGGSSILTPNFKIAINGDGADKFTTPQTTQITAGEWHHLVGTWQSGNVLQIYFDGVFKEQSAASVTGVINYNAFNTYIGYNEPDNVFTNAIIDDVRIYNRELSANDVAALYLASKGGYKKELNWIANYQWYDRPLPPLVKSRQFYQAVNRAARY